MSIQGKPSDRQDLLQWGILLRQSGEAQPLVKFRLQVGKLEAFFSKHLGQLCKFTNVKPAKFEEKTVGNKSRVN